MAKIARFGGNYIAVAQNASASNRYIFGKTSQSSPPLNSDTLDDNLNSTILSGWVPPVKPPVQWMNAVHFTLGQTLAYLHQTGIAEWHAQQEYHQHSLTNYQGVIYTSLINNNVNNQPDTSPSQWQTITATGAVPSSRTITAGNGLTGGGNLGADITIDADYATQAQAEAGTNNSKLMTPLRVKQAIDTLAPASLATRTVNSVITTTGNITLAENYRVLPVDATSGNIVLTLQENTTLQPSGAPFDVIVIRVDNSTNSVTIQRTGSDTINGATSISLGVRYDFIQIVGSGNSTSWRGLKSSLASIVSALGNVSGTTTLDLVTGIRSYSATVTGATTFVFSNPRASGNEDIFTLRLTNGGSSTVTWPTSVKWAGGTAPTLTASGVDELVFKTINGGSNWSGVALLDVK